ncbi:hypothetical protein AAG906_031573 [Vitis piasezkii]
MSSRESNTDSGKKEAKVAGDGSTGKGSGTPCSGAGMMAAPGQAGECISREAFESNPKAYFADLHAKEKGSPKPNK